ncbi:hypothetical protein SHAb15599_00192 [Acinetobacter phage SH-Ab 15599]|nr:hypothetical protein SHAb15599_00192 [Acinetobacter phage SH-Ab 15599]
MNIRRFDAIKNTPFALGLSPDTLQLELCIRNIEQFSAAELEALDVVALLIRSNVMAIYGYQQIRPEILENVPIFIEQKYRMIYEEIGTVDCKKQIIDLSSFTKSIADSIWRRVQFWQLSEEQE